MASEKGEALKDQKNKGRFFQRRKDFLILLFLFLFVWLWGRMCCVVDDNRKHEVPKQRVEDLQGWHGNIKETSWPGQTSKGPECQARACGHRRSDIQMFNNWWYRQGTPAVRSSAESQKPWLQQILTSQMQDRGPGVLRQGGGPGEQELSGLPSVWNYFYETRRLVSGLVQWVKADATRVI